MAPKSKEPEPPKEPEIINSHGKYYYKTGATYEGDVILKLQTGPEVTPETPRLRFRHGKGKYEEGAYSYVGDWAEDKMHGLGKMAFASGAVYEGQFQADKYTGQGKYTWSDGRVYTGDFVDNKPHGTGIFKDQQGHVWSGQFFNGTGPGLTLRIAQLPA